MARGPLLPRSLCPRVRNPKPSSQRFPFCVLFKPPLLPRLSWLFRVIKVHDQMGQVRHEASVRAPGTAPGRWVSEPLALPQGRWAVTHADPREGAKRTPGQSSRASPRCPTWKRPSGARGSRE